MNKLKSVLIIGLLLSVSVMVIVNDESDVKASGGGGGNENEWLDYDFMMEVTEELSNVIHREDIDWLNDIPRGRQAVR